jgi:hypothetical protein
MFGRKKDSYPKVRSDKDEPNIVYVKDGEEPHNKIQNNKGKNENKIILHTNSGLYYGGHKAHLAGGFVHDSIGGELILTKKELVFITYKTGWKLSKGVHSKENWRMIIPLKDILVEKWNIEEKSRRKTFSGGNIPLAFGISHMNGKIEETGKTHNIVIPYIDSNGIEQEPRFGVTSFRGKAIKKWAETFYNLVAEIHKNEMERESKNNKEVKIKDNEPLKVLKMRLAKGEITKEEYQEMKSMLE